MIRKLAMVIMLCLGSLSVACNADRAASDEAVASSENTLSLKSGTSKTRVPPVGTIVSNVDPQRACTCADHPKPKYTCNQCDVINGKCHCFYGLTSAGPSGN